MNLMERPSYSQFAVLVGTEFEVEFDEQTIHLELIEALDRGQIQVQDPDQTERTIDSYSLLFHLKEDCPVTQGTIPIQHESFGEIPLFVVNVGAKDGGYLLESIIS